MPEEYVHWDKIHGIWYVNIHLPQFHITDLYVYTITW